MDELSRQLLKYAQGLFVDVFGGRLPLQALEDIVLAHPLTDGVSPLAGIDALKAAIVAFVLKQVDEYKVSLRTEKAAFDGQLQEYLALLRQMEKEAIVTEQAARDASDALDENTAALKAAIASGKPTAALTARNTFRTIAQTSAECIMKATRDGAREVGYALDEFEDSIPDFETMGLCLEHALEVFRTNVSAL